MVYDYFTDGAFQATAVAIGEILRNLYVVSLLLAALLELLRGSIKGFERTDIGKLYLRNKPFLSHMNTQMLKGMVVGAITGFIVGSILASIDFLRGIEAVTVWDYKVFTTEQVRAFEYVGIGLFTIGGGVLGFFTFLVHGVNTYYRKRSL